MGSGEQPGSGAGPVRVTEPLAEAQQVGEKFIACFVFEPHCAIDFNNSLIALNKDTRLDHFLQPSSVISVHIL